MKHIIEWFQNRIDAAEGEARRFEETAMTLKLSEKCRPQLYAGMREDLEAREAEGARLRGELAQAKKETELIEADRDAWRKEAINRRKEAAGGEDGDAATGAATRYLAFKIQDLAKERDEAREEAADSRLELEEVRDDLPAELEAELAKMRKGRDQLAVKLKEAREELGRIEEENLEGENEDLSIRNEALSVTLANVRTARDILGEELKSAKAALKGFEIEISTGRRIGEQQLGQVDKFGRERDEADRRVAAVEADLANAIAARDVWRARADEAHADLHKAKTYLAALVKAGDGIVGGGNALDAKLATANEDRDAERLKAELAVELAKVHEGGH
jgi:chromosome segregation ATPase